MGNKRDADIIAEMGRSTISSPENIDEQWAAIKSALISGADEVVGQVPKGRHWVWLTART